MSGFTRHHQLELRRLRGRIIRAMYTSMGTDLIAPDLVYAQVSPRAGHPGHITRELFDRQVDYLQQGGFVRVEQVEDPFKIDATIPFIGLTVAGVDLYEGNRPAHASIDIIR